MATEKRIILIEAIDRLLAPFPADLRNYTAEQLRGMGVEILFNTKVSGAEPERVLLADGTFIPSHTLFWCAGVSAAPLAAHISTNRAANGRIPVGPDLTIPEHPEVFVIGDLAYLVQDGVPLPMTAPVAMQEGEYAGKAILRRIAGRDRSTRSASGTRGAWPPSAEVPPLPSFTAGNSPAILHGWYGSDCICCTWSVSATVWSC